MWSVVEREANEYSPEYSQNNAQYEPQGHLIRAWKRFRSRKEAVIKAEGSFVE